MTLVLLVMTSMVAVVSAQGEDDKAAESENGDHGDHGYHGDNGDSVDTARSVATTGGFTRALTCNFIPRPQRHFENCVQRRFCDGRMIPCRTPSGQQYRCSGRVHTGWVCTTQNTGRACNWMLKNCR
jgi:hypothetical protein